MSERDELVIILERHLYASEYGPEDSADAILAAGYCKPRTITTAEELDALPIESIIMEHACNDPIQRYEIGWCFGGEGIDVRLPATVLWEPRKGEGGADE